MSEPKWTPGPWKAVKRGTQAFNSHDNLKRGGFRIDQEIVTDRSDPQAVGISVAKTYGLSEQETSNAHLLAAAPELYQALEQARTVIVLLVKSLPQEEALADYTALLDDAEQADLAATAALAKARGESQ